MKKYVFESLNFFCAAILCTILSASFASPSWGALPSGYTELEYIESTGTQYIDTGYVFQSTNIKYDIDFQYTASTGYNYLLGALGNNGFVGVYKSGSKITQISGGALDRVTYLIDFDTNRHQYTFNDSTGKVTLDGIEYALSHTLSAAPTRSLYLFSRNYTSDGDYAYAKIYSVKLYDNNTLVRDMVPAKDSSGKIGMYDTVNNRFYTNAGTGEFVAGAPVTTCDGTVVNYVSATGTGVQNGTPTPDNPIDPVFYQQGNMVLRKVGDYADSYDASTGKITRRVGVKVLDGTESWMLQSINQYGIANFYMIISTIDSRAHKCSHFQLQTSLIADTTTEGFFIAAASSLYIRRYSSAFSTPAKFKAWLASEYANGTPVTIYYPLTTEVVEDWTETSYCFNPIKIATTKYNETAFSPLNTALANAISVVDSVVSNTITQAGHIATLQTQKQTRPADDPTDANNAENCPAGKKCLLVTDENNVPHWYEIVEKYSRLPDGYTELEYIEGTGTQYIDTGIANNSLTNPTVEITLKMLEFADVIWFGTPTVGAKGIFYNIQTSSPETWYVRWCSQRYDDRPLTYQPGKSVLDLVFTDALHTVKLTGTTNLSVYVDDELVGTSTYDSCAFTATGNILLFGVALSDTKRKMQLGMWKISNNDTLLQHLIPAKRNSDGAIGMFDTVSGEFFTNKGSGSFIAGPVTE